MENSDGLHENLVRILEELRDEKYEQMTKWEQDFVDSKIGDNEVGRSFTISEAEKLFEIARGYGIE